MPTWRVEAALPACRSILELVDLLTGPGANRVRILMRRLVVELELRAQNDRRLGAEVLRDRPRLILPPRRGPSVTLAPRSTATGSTQVLVEECRRRATELSAPLGRGGFGVQSAACQLVVALELYEQDQRRLGSESLRQELPATAPATLLLTAALAADEGVR